MIRHVVMFKFADFAGEKSKAENVSTAKAMLDRLPSVIPEIKAQTTAIASGAGSDYDLLLISDFESFEALGVYKVHPDHVAVGDFMRPVRISRACVDFEI